MKKYKNIYVVLLFSIFILAGIYMSNRSNLIFDKNNTINETIETKRVNSLSTEQFLYKKKYIISKSDIPIIDILYLKDNKYINYQLSLENNIKINIPKNTDMYISVNEMNILEGNTWDIEYDSQYINIVGDNSNTVFFSDGGKSESIKNKYKNKLNRQLFQINSLNKSGESKIQLKNKSNKLEFDVILNFA